MVVLISEWVEKGLCQALPRALSDNRSVQYQNTWGVAQKVWLNKIEDSEDIQMFFSRRHIATKHIESINEFCDKTLRIEITNWQIRAKPIEAVECIPKFTLIS